MPGNPTHSRSHTRSLTGLLAPALVLITTSATYAEEARLDDVRAFADMIQLIRDHYVEEIPETELMRLAMQGLAGGLDDHSGWLPPRRFREHDDGSRGRQGGIGAAFDIRDQRLYVSELSPDGPAEKAGILPGDQLLAVDDEPVRGRALHRSIEAIGGEVGTTVELRLRGAGDAPREVQLERAYIPVDSVDGHWLAPGTAYLAISHFNDHSATDFERELERLAAMPESAPVAQVVIDLRDNRGGVLPPALAIADGFLDEGLVVETRGRTPSTRMEYIAQPGQWHPDAAVAVLVGPLTASSSEILAGALQDHGRARVFGMNSFGKGTVQSVVPLRNGSALKFTTAKYYTPSGREIEGSGIKPDIVVEGGVHPVGKLDDPVVAVAYAALTGAESD
mgnify:CR=1 FL=1